MESLRDSSARPSYTDVPTRTFQCGRKKINLVFPLPQYAPPAYAPPEPDFEHQGTIYRSPAAGTLSATGIRFSNPLATSAKRPTVASWVRRMWPDGLLLMFVFFRG
jgi:hypothetical protein